MKKFVLATTVALMALTGASQANAVAMTPKTIKYDCNGNELLVTYHFNDAGLPTKAVTKLNGKKTLTLKYNQTFSDNVSTMFGSSKGFNFSTEYMDTSNYYDLDIGPIMNPKSKIIYKSCSPNM